MGKIGYEPSLADGKTLADIMREVKFRKMRKFNGVRGKR